MTLLLDLNTQLRDIIRQFKSQLDVLNKENNEESCKEAHFNQQYTLVQSAFICLDILSNFLKHYPQCIPVIKDTFEEVFAFSKVMSTYSNRSFGVIASASKDKQKKANKKSKKAKSEIEVDAAEGAEITVVTSYDIGWESMKLMGTVLMSESSLLTAIGSKGGALAFLSVSTYLSLNSSVCFHW